MKTRFTRIFIVCLMAAMLLSNISIAETAGLFDEPKVFSFYIGSYWHTTLLDENFNDTVSVALREATNVTLDIDLVRVDNDDTELNMMIASENLPDMVFVEGLIRTQMIEDGLVIPLDDLVEKYGPNIKQNFGFVLNDWRDPDGKLYGLGCFVWNDPKYALNFSENTVYMRYDILKEMGYEKLDRQNEYDSFITVAEYEQLLDRVKAEYPAMKPMLFDAGNAVDVLFNSKGHQTTEIRGNAPASFEDGKAVSRYSSKYMQEFITKLNDFFTKGYTPEDVATLTKEQMLSMIATGEVFSTFGYVNGLEEAQAALGEISDDHRMVMFYLTDNDSVKDVFVNNYAVAEPAHLMITTTCENPEEVIQYLDFCASYEGSRIIGAGVEGVTYTVDDKGWMIPVDEVLKGYAAWDTNMIKKYGIGSWLNILPNLEGIGPNGQSFDINAEAAFKSNRWVMYNNTDYTHIAYPRLLSSVGQLNSETQWEAFDALSKISAYFGDRLAKAAVAPNREAAMAEWEKTVAQMKADGLQKLDEAVSEAWIKLVDHYQRTPDKLIFTEAHK